VSTVAALYIDPRGPYPKMVDVDCWDEARDAKRYDGPHPVVAHPPCGPWGRLRFMCTKQDPSCGPRAVDQVREFGGLLEHPADSQLWRRCFLPRPGEFTDGYGHTYLVRQVAWGHCCEKPTWLYVVGIDRRTVEAGIRTGGTATHRVTSGPRGPRLPSATKSKRIHSPPEFAEWLVELTRSAKRSPGAAG
jgi:hypothetical protein